MTKNATLDDFDKKILAYVQRDNQMTHAQIGEQVGLSASAVRRRLSELRRHGVIKADAAILSADDFGVTLIASISFGDESPEIYDAFDEQMRSLSPVKQSYHVAGTTDYMLIIHGPSLHWYEKWAKDVFMTNPAIARYSTIVAWACKKFDTSLDLQ